MPVEYSFVNNCAAKPVYLRAGVIASDADKFNYITQHSREDASEHGTFLNFLITAPTINPYPGQLVVSYPLYQVVPMSLHLTMRDENEVSTRQKASHVCTLHVDVLSITCTVGQKSTGF